MKVGTNKMIAGGFGCRVGTIGCKRRGFRKCGILGPEGPVDFICGNVKKPEIRRLTECVLPVEPRLMEKLKGSLNVGLGERLGRINGTVDMGFGCKINNRVYFELPKQLRHQFRVPDISLNKGIGRMVNQVGINGPSAQGLGTAVGSGVASVLNSSLQYSGTSAGVGSGSDTSKISLSNSATLVGILLSNLQASQVNGQQAPRLASGLGLGIANLVQTGFGFGGVSGSPSVVPAVSTSVSLVF